MSTNGKSQDFGQLFSREKLPVDIIVVVWGKQYTSLFLNVVIPNYLSPGNLPTIAKNNDVRFRLFTTEEDKALIAQHKSWKQLQKLCPVEFVPVIDGKVLSNKSKWGAKGYCQSLALKDAMNQRKVVFFLNPDSLISDGGLAKALGWIDKGKKTVLVAELVRAEIESVVPELLGKFYDPEQNVLNLSSRALVELGIKHMHDIGKILFWKGKVFSRWPSLVYWKVGEKSLLAKFFHWHPILIDLRTLAREVPDVLMPDDGGLIEYLGIKSSELYPMTDSEESAWVELSSKFMELEDSRPHQPRNKTWAILKWALRAASVEHRQQFLKWNIHYQGDDGFL